MLVTRTDVARWSSSSSARAGGAATALADRRGGAPARATRLRGAATRTRASSPRLEVPLDEPPPGTARSSDGFPPSTPSARRRRARRFPESPWPFTELAAHDSFLSSRWSRAAERTGCSSCPGRSRTALSTEDRQVRRERSPARRLRRSTERAHFESEQTIAETLQRSVLPASLPRVEGVQLAARYLPGTAGVNVGGDWFDAIRLADGQLGLVVGDVVGKGVNAAATMAQLRNALRAFALDRMKPSSTMTRLNRLAEETETTFATRDVSPSSTRTPASAGLRLAGPPAASRRVPGRPYRAPRGRSRVAARRGADTKYHAGRSRAAGRNGAASSTPTAWSSAAGSRSTKGLARLRQAVLEGPREPQKLVEHLLERLAESSRAGDDIALLGGPTACRRPATADSAGAERDRLARSRAGRTSELGRRNRAQPRRRPGRRARRLGGLCQLDRALRERTGGRAGRTS